MQHLGILQATFGDDLGDIWGWACAVIAGSPNMMRFAQELKCCPQQKVAVKGLFPAYLLSMDAMCNQCECYVL